MRRSIGLLFVIIGLASLAAPAEAGSLEAVRWDDGEGALHLEFDAHVPELSIDLDPSGLELTFRRTQTAVGPASPLSVRAEGEDLVVRLEGRGIRLAGLKTEGVTLTLRAHLPSSDDGYRVGPGDVISVVVSQDEELTGEYPVAQDGTIQLGFVGRVSAQGRTESELAEYVRERLAEFYIDPGVSLVVQSFASQYVYVTGAVQNSARVAIGPGTTLKDVLSTAGVALAPEQTVVLSRTRGEEGERLTLSAADLEGGASPPMRDGDVIVVQQQNYVFVEGEVRKPGPKIYLPGLTLLQAISLAEGLTDWANRKEVLIMRRRHGEAVDEVVNLRKIEQRVLPDPEIRPGDMIRVRRRAF